jgi:lipoyl(octanoyl) transferase|tara:strand:- start:488 stop:1099 length:612 start_codon:yes stop_codon:yes gene_type:complete
MNIEIKISKRKIPYKTAIKILQKRVENIKADKGCDLLWILEHPLTYTAGIRSSKNDILDKQLEVLKTERGGKVTLHNPGQKIVYFALNLNKRKKDIRKLINTIEKSIIEFLKIYNIDGKRDKNNIGIWVGNKKIAAIGLRISRWVAYYGCSININNNLKDYLKIIPCGLNNKKVTSVYNEKRQNIKNVDKNILNIFIENINNI